MARLLGNYDVKESVIEEQPDCNRTLKVASAVSCVKELYELGEMTEEAYKAVVVHFIEIAGYELISRDF